MDSVFLGNQKERESAEREGEKVEGLGCEESKDGLKSFQMNCGKGKPGKGWQLP